MRRQAFDDGYRYLGVRFDPAIPAVAFALEAQSMRRLLLAGSLLVACGRASTYDLVVAVIAPGAASHQRVAKTSVRPAA
jgi:hypothetical protein